VIVSVPDDVPTLQQAIDDTDADTVILGPGAWEGATVDRPVHLIGEPGAVIRRGVSVSEGRVGLLLVPGADGTVIDGITFECDDPELEFGVVASTHRFGAAPSHVTITGNRFAGCVQAVTNTGGFREECTDTRVDGGAWWVVRDNVVDGLATKGRGGGVGVFLYNTRGAEVSGNLFTGEVADGREFATAAVGLAGCLDCIVAENQFEVRGGRYWYTAVTNLGGELPGAVASRNLLLTLNDAFDDSAPWQGVSFRSRGSVATESTENVGVTWIDHEACGDGVFALVEE